MQTPSGSPPQRLQIQHVVQTPLPCSSTYWIGSTPTRPWMGNSFSQQVSRRQSSHRVSAAFFESLVKYISEHSLQLFPSNTLHVVHNRLPAWRSPADLLLPTPEPQLPCAPQTHPRCGTSDPKTSSRAAIPPCFLSQLHQQ